LPVFSLYLTVEPDDDPISLDRNSPAGTRQCSCSDVWPV